MNSMWQKRVLKVTSTENRSHSLAARIFRKYASSHRGNILHKQSFRCNILNTNFKLKCLKGLLLVPTNTINSIIHSQEVQRLS